MEELLWFVSRSRGGALMALVAASVACSDSTPLPVLERVEPMFVSQQTGADAVVFGENLFLSVEVSLNDDAPPSFDSGWVITIEGEPAGGVEYFGPEEIGFVIPPGLRQRPGDPYEVGVISPRQVAVALPDAFQVVECTEAACGDGYCCGAFGETPCSCPSDCGAGSCGDGVCCPAEDAASCGADCVPTCGNGACDAGETSQTCPGDCVNSCGDGTCDADETPESCANDCGTCSSDCGTCGDGCCAEKCGDENNCSLSCDVVDCTCFLACNPAANRCGFDCQSAACNIDCRDARNCDVDCDGAVSCAIDCTNAERCDPKCRDAEACKIDCTGSDCLVKCDDADSCQVACPGGRCRLECNGATECEIVSCDGPVASCAGNVSVCGQSC